MVIVQYKVHTA